MSFDAAHDNFTESAKHGIDARLYWPQLGSVTADELVLRTLLPMAHEGLTRWVSMPTCGTAISASSKAGRRRAAMDPPGRWRQSAPSRNAD